jgi:hypothetical protein
VAATPGFEILNLALEIPRLDAGKPRSSDEPIAFSDESVTAGTDLEAAPSGIQV